MHLNTRVMPLHVCASSDCVQCDDVCVPAANACSLALCDLTAGRSRTAGQPTLLPIAVTTLHVLRLLPPVGAADISGLQQPDGAFAGDKWGEIDTR
jgi:hypothetical protein